MEEGRRERHVFQYLIKRSVSLDCNIFFGGGIKFIR